MVGNRHSWSEDDYFVGLYLYRFGVERLGGWTLEDAARVLGITPGSMRMCLGNYQALAGKGGLGNYGSYAPSLWDQFGASPEKELRPRVLEILTRTS